MARFGGHGRIDFERVPPPRHLEASAADLHPPQQATINAKCPSIKLRIRVLAASLRTHGRQDGPSRESDLHATSPVVVGGSSSDEPMWLPALQAKPFLPLAAHSHRGFREAIE